MDDAFYSDGGSQDGNDPAEEKGETTDSIDEEEAENPTALIPMSALGDNAKEGDVITMRVKKVYGDEVEVSISSSKDSKPKKESQSPDEELDSMDSMKGGRYGSM